MSVIVKGMEMPRSCDRCELADSAGIGLCRIEKRIWDPDPGQPLRPYWCPLAELPEKHGRLIDDSQLRETFGMSERCNECKQDEWDCKYNQLFTRMDFCGWLDEMDTIVEAEGD